jgi:hypothetical protein
MRATGTNTDQKISHGFAAASIALPLLGLLFFSVPWEGDPRTERPEKRYERLSDPQRAFLVSVLSGISGDGPGNKPNWNGLFPWEEADLVVLKLKRSAQAEPVLEENTASDLDYAERPSQIGALHPYEQGAKDTVDEILRTGRNPNEIELWDREMPLGAMAAALDIERTKALLVRGANPNFRDGAGRRPLQILIGKCRSGLALQRLKTCTKYFGGNRNNCQAEETEVETAWSDDEKLKPAFEILVAAGAGIDRKISSEIPSLNGLARPPRDITTLQYARLSCSISIVNAIVGKAR